MLLLGLSLAACTGPTAPGEVAPKPAEPAKAEPEANETQVAEPEPEPEPEPGETTSATETSGDETTGSEGADGGAAIEESADTPSMKTKYGAPRPDPRPAKKYGAPPKPGPF
ncbi:hypothetical protein DB30_02582 [Enhygromyxa salina]|uniref:Uncharacterized protein n=2 Tax=Enhygromyxa salina TaxID=215803 RepID=A0A0C1ZLT5_9BACT|nr:hypothetical protein DB30_02582 [Enhygromyxa salina]